jgi:hypothetical protein
MRAPSAETNRLQRIVTPMASFSTDWPCCFRSLGIHRFITWRKHASSFLCCFARFSTKHLATGKYWLLARSIPDTEKDTQRPAAFDSTERAKLRKEAEAAKNEIELKPCQRVKDHVLRW